MTPSLHQTLAIDNSRAHAGFTVHSPHSHGGSALQRCVAVIVLVAGSAAFAGLVVWPVVNIIIS